NSATAAWRCLLHSAYVPIKSLMDTSILGAAQRINMTCQDAYDQMATRAVVMQHKTQRPVQFEITQAAREALQASIKHAGLKSEDFLFPSRMHGSPPLGARQYARILGHWVDELGLDRANYGTHSMRRTMATLIYRRTNLRAVQLLLGHSRLKSTVRYLGIEVDDALEIAEQTEI
uniref:tyrosine-type recombinase/integrase n=1 Tax=Pelomonas sp. BJYL3 TaxID=2976697 RepID=UPI0022B41162